MIRSPYLILHTDFHHGLQAWFHGTSAWFHYRRSRCRYPSHPILSIHNLELHIYCVTVWYANWHAWWATLKFNFEVESSITITPPLHHRWPTLTSQHCNQTPKRTFPQLCTKVVKATGKMRNDFNTVFKAMQKEKAYVLNTPWLNNSPSLPRS